jgi:hypothetical protein
MSNINRPWHRYTLPIFMVSYVSEFVWDPPSLIIVDFRFPGWITCVCNSNIIFTYIFQVLLTVINALFRCLSVVVRFCLSCFSCVNSCEITVFTFIIESIGCRYLQFIYISFISIFLISFCITITQITC